MHPHITLIYASSSSVYGLNHPPFRIEDATDQPTNLYGATKKANEVMAHAYHHLYGFSVTGLRYFTVYGPWGRPDMSYFRFATQMEAGASLQVFHGGQMTRDFTYIDDIISGTIAALDHSFPCELFNLGSGISVDLLTFIEHLEASFGKKAKKELLPPQRGEVIATCADIEKSRQLLGFVPTVPLKEGLRHFAEWYRTMFLPLKVD